MRRLAMTDETDASMTLKEWLDKHRISRSMFYKMRDDGLTPRTFMIGNSIRISARADRVWIQDMEEQSNESPP